MSFTVQLKVKFYISKRITRDILCGERIIVISSFARRRRRRSNPWDKTMWQVRFKVVIVIDYFLLRELIENAGCKTKIVEKSDVRTFNVYGRLVHIIRNNFLANWICDIENELSTNSFTNLPICVRGYVCQLACFENTFFVCPYVVLSISIIVHYLYNGNENRMAMKFLIICLVVKCRNI